MPKHERPKKGRGQGQEARRQQTEVIEETKTRSEDQAQAIRDGLDEVLDEIDEVLEQNAQEFVNQYIQKGGE